jgi:hypothetical protein
MSDVDRFIADLEHELHSKKLTLLESEFLAALEAKEATREQICAWAKVFYADEPRRELAQNVYEEETGRISGVGMCHMDVFRLLLDDFGITKEQARRLPSPLGDRMPQGSAIPTDEFYVALATYGFCVEIPNAEWSARMARAGDR